MTELDYDSIDFFRDNAVVADPFPYFEHLRGKCPVIKEQHHDVVMVTGWSEITEILSDNESFSACNTVTGPFPGLPLPDDAGDDISAYVAEHRAELPFSDQLPSMDPPVHTAHRGLLMKLLTLRSLKENEEFLWRLADYQIDQFIDQGEVNIQKDYAAPLAMLVIADLLGVPEEDHKSFRKRLASGGGHGNAKSANVGSTEGELEMNPLEWLYSVFAAYLEDRRENPREDVLTGLANAKFPDGSTPSVDDVCRIASNLFAAGQETTVRLISSAVKILAENPEIQQTLREHPEKIDNFVEETLRFESPIKGDFRMCQRSTEVAGVEIPAGTTVMSVYAAANRDPRQFEDPQEFKLGRPNARQHLAFGRGVHTCPGGPLARTEGRVAVTRLLQRMGDIRIDERFHGPEGDRHYDYAPTYILRGLNALHVTFTKLQ
ncbi:MAG TPA: cytochrome P450 [Nocardioides sp.]|nr:cytochrome P450 [Nocardioides sp.]